MATVTRTCSKPDCERPFLARELCKKHYYDAGHGFTPKPCRIPGCSLLTTNKTGDGLCENHYARVRRHGDTSALLYARTRGTTLADVLLERSEPSGDCVLWLGSTNEQGYASAVRRDDGTFAAAHRVSWELANGPVPTGLTLDHLCHNIDMSCNDGAQCKHRRCINPDHMEPVTQAENSWRRNHRTEFAASRQVMVSGICVQDDDGEATAPDA